MLLVIQMHESGTLWSDWCRHNIADSQAILSETPYKFPVPSNAIVSSAFSVFETEIQIQSSKTEPLS